MTKNGDETTQALEESNEQYMPEETEVVEQVSARNPDSFLATIQGPVRMVTHAQEEGRCLPIAATQLGRGGHLIIYALYK